MPHVDVTGKEEQTAAIVLLVIAHLALAGCFRAACVCVVGCVVVSLTVSCFITQTATLQLNMSHACLSHRQKQEVKIPENVTLQLYSVKFNLRALLKITFLYRERYQIDDYKLFLSGYY